MLCNDWRTYTVWNLSGHSQVLERKAKQGTRLGDLSASIKKRQQKTHVLTVVLSSVRRNVNSCFFPCHKAITWAKDLILSISIHRYRQMKRGSSIIDSDSVDDFDPAVGLPTCKKSRALFFLTNEFFWISFSVNV